MKNISRECFMASMISRLLVTTGSKQLSVNETIPYEHTASEWKLPW